MRVKPKKSLGQNFLHDKNIINKIIDASEISNNDEKIKHYVKSSRRHNLFLLVNLMRKYNRFDHESFFYI